MVALITLRKDNPLDRGDLKGYISELANLRLSEEDLQSDETGEVQLTQRQPDILEALSGLVDKSFLQHTSTGRYEVHELMRQYGAAKLAADPDNEARTRDMHAAYYLNLVAKFTFNFLF